MIKNESINMRIVNINPIYLCNRILIHILVG